MQKLTIALILISVIVVFSRINNNPLPQNPRRQSIMEKLTPKIEEKNLYKVVSDLSAFYNRHYLSETGFKASRWVIYEIIFKMLNQLPAERRKLFHTDKTRLVTHKEFPQQSVICVMEGSSLKDEVVVIGAHVDSVNSENSSGAAPGAGF
jgi:bacterial leucyl aminopeptidase